jgi:hemolysin III
VAWNLLRGPLKWGTLASAWSAAAIGSGWLLCCGLFSIFWSTCFYLAMGWGAIVCYIELARIHSHRTVFPLLLGGVLYSVGAALNLANWPVLWPGVFGPHEVFHLFVMGGSTAHFLFMLGVVARPPAAACAPLTPREPVPGRSTVVRLGRIATERFARGLERFPDPRIPQYFRVPLYLHAAPHWSRRPEVG